MKRKLIVILSLLSFFPVIVFAKECSDSLISTKKNLASNISWVYEYYLQGNKMFYNVIVSNVFDDLYVKNLKDNKKYTGNEFTIRNLSDNQKLTFQVFSKACNTLVLTKEIELPKYNTFYGTKYCEGISEFSYCGKWSNLGDSVDLNILKKETEKYRESLKPKEVEFTKYETDITGFYVFISLILISLFLVLFFMHAGKKKKDFI